MNAEDYDVQDNLDSQASDPDYLIFAAKCDAETHHDHGIPIHEGIASLVRGQLRSGMVFSRAEIEAYMDTRASLAADLFLADMAVAV